MEIRLLETGMILRLPRTSGAQSIHELIKVIKKKRNGERILLFMIIVYKATEHVLKSICSFTDEPR